MAIRDLADGLVFLAIAHDAGGDRIETARWSSDPGDREIEFANLPQRRKRTGAAKGTLSELTHLEATVRRWSAGRTVIVREANVLRERLEKSGWISLPRCWSCWI